MPHHDLVPPVLARFPSGALLALLLALTLLVPDGAAGSIAPVDPPVVPAGAYDWPLTGVGDGPPAHGGQHGAVARRFVAPPHPFGRGHRGADLVAPPGAAVVAAGAGVVVFAGSVGGRGVVSVEHADGLRTTYEPVTATVAVGAAVSRGSPLGELAAGHRGCPATACLHWGLRRPAPQGSAHRVEYLDPLLLLGLGTVRLLPTGEP